MEALPVVMGQLAYLLLFVLPEHKVLPDLLEALGPNKYVCPVTPACCLLVGHRSGWTGENCRGHIARRAARAIEELAQRVGVAV